MGRENPTAPAGNINSASKQDIYRKIKLSLEAENRTSTEATVTTAGKQSEQAAAYAASALAGSRKSSKSKNRKNSPNKPVQQKAEKIADNSGKNKELKDTEKNTEKNTAKDESSAKASADKADTKPETENKEKSSAKDNNSEKIRKAEKAAAEITAEAEKASSKRNAPGIDEIPSQQSASKSQRKRIKKSGGTAAVTKNNTLTAFLIAFIILAALALIYMLIAFSYRNKFLPNTFVNGVNIAGMSTEEAEKAIIESAEDDTLTFVEQDGEKVTFTGDQYESVYKLPGGSLDDAAAESRALWLGKLLKGSDYNISLEHTYSDDAIKEIVSAYDWGYVAPKNAEIISDDSGNFSIKPEDNGNSVKTDVLGEYAVEQIKSGVNEIVMTDSDCYEKAKITSEDLVDTLDLYNRIGNVSINFEMTNREELFDPVGTENINYKTIADWLTIVDDRVVVNGEKAQEWVRENIAKYDTYVEGYTRQFTTTMDGTIELPLGATGIYGWSTDVEATADKLIQLIMTGESCSTEPVYAQEGFRMHSDTEGYAYTKKTYIEISLTRQHLWYYIDGEMVLESDVVTGMSWDPSRSTPPGMFDIWSREANVILGTYAIQGYECPVDFWMPIDYTGIGLHDLYHASYGGNVRDWEGSHGCINLPWDTASAIFDYCVVGTPVVITP
ncbi:MAG: L,D-transpeptidase family protein [Ruminococcus sp.]|nr:L,D-transpeptidase family protein [Ruminococcus sp.]